MATVSLTTPNEATSAVASSSGSHDPDHHRIVDATNRGIDDLDLPIWLAFTTAACVTRMFVQYPFILAMTRRQAFPALSSTPSTVLLGKLYKQETGKGLFSGFRSWFRGFGAMTTGMVLSEVIYMWWFEWLRNQNGIFAKATKASDGHESSQAWLDAVAGFSADVSTTVLSVPFFLVANRQMCAGTGVGKAVPYENSLLALRRVLNTGGGVRGMFCGIVPSFWMSTHSAFWWAGYGDLKTRFYGSCKPQLEYLHKEHPWIPTPFVSTTDNVVLNTTAAVLVATVVAVIWNPVLVVRTRMQCANVEHLGQKERMRDVVKTVWKAEGARGFSKGTCMSIVANAIDAVAFSVLYELGKQLAEKY